MKWQWEKQYQELVSALNNCHQEHKNELARLECCFLISSNATASLLKEVLQSGFKTTEEEIQFFKKVKPKFYSEVEFFRLLYHVELFEPHGEQKIIREFWLREAERLPRFILENQEFYAYWKGEREDRDVEYFGISSNSQEMLTDIFYQSKEVAKHDHLVATLLALEKFNDYVKLKLNDINSDAIKQ